MEALDAIGALRRAWMWHTTKASKETNTGEMKPENEFGSGLVRYGGISVEDMSRIDKETKLLYAS